MQITVISMGLVLFIVFIGIGFIIKMIHDEVQEAEEFKASFGKNFLLNEVHQNNSSATMDLDDENVKTEKYL